MVNLLYYARERLIFLDEFRENIDKRAANKIIKELIRHFKIKSHNEWKFTGGASSKCITWKDTKQGSFRFSKKHLSIGVICHELAHAIEMNKRGRSTHASKHFKIMKRLINYCRKQGYVSKAMNGARIIVEGKEGLGMSTQSMILNGYIVEAD